MENSGGTQKDPSFPCRRMQLPGFRAPQPQCSDMGNPPPPPPSPQGHTAALSCGCPVGLKARGAAAARGPGSPPGPDHFLSILPNLQPGNELRFPFNIRLGGDGKGGGGGEREGGWEAAGGSARVLGAPQRGQGSPPGPCWPDPGQYFRNHQTLRLCRSRLTLTAVQRGLIKSFLSDTGGIHPWGRRWDR